MRKIFTSIEQYEVDQAIEEAKSSDLDNVDEMLVKVESDEKADAEQVETPSDETSTIDPTTTDETSQEINKDTTAIESIFKDIEHGKNSIKSLEAIAEIIENSHELNYITANSLPVIRVALNSIYSQVGLKESSLRNVSLESLDSLKNKITVAKESVDDIKNKIVEIWNLLISKIRQIYKYLKDLFVQRDKKAEENKTKVDKLKKIYETAKTKMDKPNSEDILGPIFTSLVANSGSVTFTNIEKIGSFTLNILNSFIKEIGQSLKTSSKNVTEIKSELFSITKDIEELGNTGDISSKIEKVKQIIEKDPITQRPSFTPLNSSSLSANFTASSKALAGGYEFAYTGLPTKWEISDLYNVRLILVENTSMQKVTSVKVIEKDQFPKALELLTNTVAVQQSMIDLNKELIDSFASFIKYAEQLQSELSKVNKLDAAFSDKEVSVRKATFKRVEAYRTITDTINNFYLKSSLMTDKYINQYTNHLLSYVEHSFREYL